MSSTILRGVVIAKTSRIKCFLRSIINLNQPRSNKPNPNLTSLDAFSYGASCSHDVECNIVINNTQVQIIISYVCAEEMTEFRNMGKPPPSYIFIADDVQNMNDIKDYVGTIFVGIMSGDPGLKRKAIILPCAFGLEYDDYKHHDIFDCQSKKSDKTFWSKARGYKTILEADTPFDPYLYNKVIQNKYFKGCTPNPYIMIQIPFILLLTDNGVKDVSFRRNFFVTKVADMFHAENTVGKPDENIDSLSVILTKYYQEFEPLITVKTELYVNESPAVLNVDVNEPPAVLKVDVNELPLESKTQTKTPNHVIYCNDVEKTFNIGKMYYYNDDDVETNRMKLIGVKNMNGGVLQFIFKQNTQKKNVMTYSTNDVNQKNILCRLFEVRQTEQADEKLSSTNLSATPSLKATEKNDECEYTYMINDIAMGHKNGIEITKTCGGMKETRILPKNKTYTINKNGKKTLIRVHFLDEMPDRFEISFGEDDDSLDRDIKIRQIKEQLEVLWNIAENHIEDSDEKGGDIINLVDQSNTDKVPMDNAGNKITIPPQPAEEKEAMMNSPVSTQVGNNVETNASAILPSTNLSKNSTKGTKYTLSCHKGRQQRDDYIIGKKYKSYQKGDKNVYTFIRVEGEEPKNYVFSFSFIRSDGKLSEKSFKPSNIKDLNFLCGLVEVPEEAMVKPEEISCFRVISDFNAIDDDDITVRKGDLVISKANHNPDPKHGDLNIIVQNLNLPRNEGYVPINMLREIEITPEIRTLIVEADKIPKTQRVNHGKEKVVEPAKSAIPSASASTIDKLSPFAIPNQNLVHKPQPTQSMKPQTIQYDDITYTCNGQSITFKIGEKYKMRNKNNEIYTITRIETSDNQFLKHVFVDVYDESLRKSRGERPIDMKSLCSLILMDESKTPSGGSLRTKKTSKKRNKPNKSGKPNDPDKFYKTRKRINRQKKKISVNRKKANKKTRRK